MKQKLDGWDIRVLELALKEGSGDTYDTANEFMQKHLKEMTENDKEVKNRNEQ